jgi:hypothetical protein
MNLATVVCTAAFSAFVTSPVETAFGGNVGEPYKALHDGAFTGRAAPNSPDPLASYQWDSDLADVATLQAYTLRPVTVTVREGLCEECDTLAKPGVATAKLTATPAAPVRIMLDFGVELPAWFEFDSADDIEATTVTMAIGEYDEPWQDTNGTEDDNSWKLGNPKKISGPNGVTYRLHTNAELYEGVRYAFLTVTSGSFTISALRLVVQTKPVNYTGHFAAPTDSLLESVWWVAAWTVRANFMKDFFGSVLIDRGDRESWTGDAHPIQAAALVAFHNLDAIKQNLAASIHGAGGGFPTYMSYWVLSVMDYYHYTGDGAVLATYAAHIEQTMMPLVKNAMSDPLIHLGFVGWDDRTGGGFANSSCVECNKDFHFILLRAVNDSAHAYAAPGAGQNTTFAAELSAAVNSLVAYLRQPLANGAPWYDELLLPSASDAIDSGVTTPEEEAILFEKLFTDAITICQLSPFNEYWVRLASHPLSSARRQCAALRASTHRPRCACSRRPPYRLCVVPDPASAGTDGEARRGVVGASQVLGRDDRARGDDVLGDVPASARVDLRRLRPRARCRVADPRPVELVGNNVARTPLGGGPGALDVPRTPRREAHGAGLSSV